MTVTAWKAPTNTAFIIVDVQNDFCPGGNLAVAGGNKIIPLINNLKAHFNTVVLTQDWHPAGHSSFASAHPGKKPFETAEMPYGTQVLWPDHCIQGTEGAALHSALIIDCDDEILQKGTNPAIDSYSAFYENDRKTQARFTDGQTFAEKMRGKGISKLVFAGLAFDYCVGWNGYDAKQEGFDVFVVEDASRSIAPETEQAMRDKLTGSGVQIVTAKNLPQALRLKP